MSVYNNRFWDPSFEGRETMIWITEDGRKIPFSDLTDSHLRNILRFLANKARRLQGKGWEDKASRLLSRRGRLVAEAKRRGWSEEEM